MVAAQPLKPSWNSGELSPRLAARTDLDKYRNGAAVLENMIPLTEGGAQRRAGTRFVAETGDSTDTSRLSKFKVSVEQAYVLEQGANYFRFFRNQGQISAGATDASITNGTFDSDTGWTKGTSACTRISGPMNRKNRSAASC